MLHLKRLVAFLDALKKFVVSWKDDSKRKSQRTEIMSVADIVGRLGTKAASINLLEVTKYLKTSKVCIDGLNITSSTTE